MNWNEHSNLPEGAHAFLGPSKYSWLNYDENKLITTYRNHLAVARGTKLHAMASDHIEMMMKMPRTRSTFNSYVNDAIGYRMKPEQKLFYSPYCFGTADSIAFDEKKGFLRIHDLKTGITPASFHQLEIYAALFFLEYGREMNFKPGDIQTELRIYQNDDIMVGNPGADIIVPVMDWIQVASKILEKIDLEGK